MSPIYLDLRRLITYPPILRRAASAYVALLKGLHFDRIAGLPYAGLPIATAISLEANWPMIYPRKEAKAYGTKANIEGLFEAGETVVMIDDLITDGGAKIEAADKLKAAGLIVKDIVVLIDRGTRRQGNPGRSRLHLARCNHAKTIARRLVGYKHHHTSTVR